MSVSVAPGPGHTLYWLLNCECTPSGDHSNGEENVAASSSDDADTLDDLRRLMSLNGTAFKSSILSVSLPSPSTRVEPKPRVPPALRRQQKQKGAEESRAQRPEPCWEDDIPSSFVASKLAQHAIAVGLEFGVAQSLKFERKHQALLDEATLIDMQPPASYLQDGRLVSEWYKSRCEELGVRLQRTIQSAFQRVERRIAHFLRTAGASSTSQLHVHAHERSSTLNSPPAVLSATMPLPGEPGAGGDDAAPQPLPSFSLPREPTSPAVPSASHHGTHDAADSTVLHASMTVLGSRGFVPVLDALCFLCFSYMRLPIPISERLTSLCFSGCGLSDRCVDCMLQMLLQTHSNTTIVHIDLSNNTRVGVEGGNAIRDFVAEPSTATKSLLLDGTSIRTATLRSIESLLRDKR